MGAVQAALALVPAVRARAGEIEAGRRLPLDLSRQMAEAGLFQLCVPADLGGLEADPRILLEVIQTVARADGSAGWNVMIGATTGLVAAWLPEQGAKEVYGTDPGVITGGVVAPKGMGTAVEGGYEVTGRWAFASGSQHCRWLMGGCNTPDGYRLMVMPAHQVEIIDTWDVVGLRGTGSHDIAVDHLFVPAQRAAEILASARHPGPLYRFPLFGILATSIAAVALGLARAALDEVIALAATKKPIGGVRSLAERAVVQVKVARAETGLRAGRALLEEVVEASWINAMNGEDSTLESRAWLRLAACHATRMATDAVDTAYEVGGGTSIYAGHPLQRHFRDVHVATQHMMVNDAVVETAGRILLGLDADTVML